MESTAYGRVAFELFGALVLALAIWSVRDSPGPTWIIVVLGVLASALSIADAVSPSPLFEGSPRPSCTRCSTSTPPAA